MEGKGVYGKGIRVLYDQGGFKARGNSRNPSSMSTVEPLNLKVKSHVDCKV